MSWLAILLTVPVTAPVNAPSKVFALTVSEPKVHSLSDTSYTKDLIEPAILASRPAS